MQHNLPSDTVQLGNLASVENIMYESTSGVLKNDTDHVTVAGYPKKRRLQLQCFDLITVLTVFLVAFAVCLFVILLTRMVISQQQEILMCKLNVQALNETLRRELALLHTREFFSSAN